MLPHVCNEAKRLTDKQCQLETETVSRPHSHLHYSVACRVLKLAARLLTNISYRRDAHIASTKLKVSHPRESADFVSLYAPTRCKATSKETSANTVCRQHSSCESLVEASTQGGDVGAKGRKGSRQQLPRQQQGSCFAAVDPSLPPQILGQLTTSTSWDYISALDSWGVVHSPARA